MPFPAHLARRSAALFILLALVTGPAHSTAAQTNARGVGVDMQQVNIKGDDGQVIRLYDKSYALLIGVSDYSAGWPKLPGVKQDIEAVRIALEKHGFTTKVVMNPTEAQLEEAYRSFIQQYGLAVENRLLFYFAGHGHTVKQSYGEDMGYIVPVDAPNPNRDLDGFRAKSLDMQSMELYARRIQSKHALFLFDSCFSGSLFALSRAVPDNIGYKTSRPVRQFITSGSADEQVPDRSIFREQFVAAIEGEADANRDGYVTGSELGDFLQDRVVNYSRNAQHPQYGKIRNPNLDKGDFVFALPKTPAPPSVAVNNTPVPAPVVVPAPVDPAQQELAFWNSIQNSTDVEDFKDYLARYPRGLYAGIAQRRVAALARGTQPQPVEPQPRPTPQSQPIAPRPQQSAPHAAPDAGRTTTTGNATPITNNVTPITNNAPPNVSRPATAGAARLPAPPTGLAASALRGYDYVTVTLDRSGVVKSRAPQSGTFYAEDLGGGVRLELVAVPGGSVQIGSDEYAAERPAHQVMLRGFYMGKYEVTQAQYQAVMGTNPSYFKGADLPVEQVSWNDAVEFCKRLSAKTGRTYRLPSEAEWEYAARAGTQTPFAFGETLTAETANYDGHYPFSSAPKGLYREQPAQVGSTGVANGFGLYDMHGNVWEWVQDYWHDNYGDAVSSPPTDGSPWLTGGEPTLRVLRGGSWYLDALSCRSANRIVYAPDNHNNDLGFRVVLSE